MAHSDNGFFNEYGGKYVAEVLRRPLDELETAFKEAMADSAFLQELNTIHTVIFDFTDMAICCTHIAITSDNKIFHRNRFRMEGARVVNNDLFDLRYANAVKQALEIV